MSSLTSIGYTATQYALLSSSYTWIGKVLKGFSGLVVDNLAASFGQMHAYAIYFIGCGALGLPALILCLLIAGTQRRREALAKAAEAAPA